MQFLTATTVLFMTLTSTLALPAPYGGNTPTLTLRQEAGAGMASMNQPSAPVSTGSSSTPGNATVACSPAVRALAAGIQANIDDQKNELTTVTALGNVLAQNPMDMTLYGATQTSLMGFVTKGILIRETNQKLAPANNGAVAGLAIVAMAQQGELNLTMGLAIPASGTVNVIQANESVETLKKNFSGGSEQNQKNLLAATAGCKM
ncbi:hypothetical protein VTL71DRAFT_13061 [Oculimacula yallundae]|uniref:Uncharacterized protein n=1 Tax=Oculimacula yallundae TaxID=86028 RepID=A0ABR4CR08_9HELO